MRHDDVLFHNVAEVVGVPERDGRLLQRVPEAVRTELNEGAARRVRHPAGVELRFVPDGEVELTLSIEPRRDVETAMARVFWGPFRGGEREIGSDPTTVSVSPPEQLRALDPAVVEGLRFDPRVCRVALPGEHRGSWVYYHGRAGECRPPRADELPDRTYLAYGTSITEGEAALGEHLTYVTQVATRLGTDAINLGTCGSAYCDPAMAEHVATRDDWDVATLALSVNMVGTFTPGEFRERAANVVNSVAGANPDRPVVPITIYPNARDILESHPEATECERFREELRDVVAETPHGNVHLLEGSDVLAHVGGLTTDLVHPGDDAMIRMGENLAGELEALL